MRAVEDEMHVVMKCPAYQTLRDKYDGTLFAFMGGSRCAAAATDEHMRLFMNQEPTLLVAKFITELMSGTDYDI